MRLFPPFYKVKVKIEKPTEFYEYLNNAIGKRGSMHSGQLVGKINKDGFLAEKKLKYSNAGRPMIRGKFEKGKDDFLIIYIECKNGPIIFIIFFLATLLITGMIKMDPYIILIVLLFFYFGFWLLYLVDLRKTEIEMEEIIKKASQHL